MNAFTNIRMYQKGLIIVGVPLLFEFVFLSILIELQLDSEQRTQEAVQSREILATADGLSKLFYDGVRSLLTYNETRNDIARRDCDRVINQIGVQLTSLKDLTRDSQVQATNFAQLEPLASRMLSALREIEGGLKNNPSFLDQWHQMHSRSELAGLLNQLGSALFQLEAAEKKARQDNPDAEKNARMLVLEWLVGGVTCNLLLALFLVCIFTKDVSGRLNVLTDNTSRLSNRKELNPPVPGSDEIAQLDNVFHTMAQKLADAERRKQEFIAMISHDLKAPLSSIQGFLAALSKGVYTEQVDQIGHRAHNLELDTIRLIDLINQILEADKTELDDSPLYYDTFPIAAVIQRGIEAVRYLAEQRGIQFEINAGDVVAYGDEDLLLRALQNFLSNAVKFSPPHATIIVSANENSERTEVTVEDSGPGIAEEHVDHVFEKFRQVPLSDGVPKTGTGLGLAICKAIVEKHGGTVGVRSEPGKGSTFWFCIPTLPHGTAYGAPS